VVEEIRHQSELIAIVISQGFQREGTEFFTDPSLPQQVAYLRYDSGKTIAAHTHRPVAHRVSYTSEVLVIRKGKVRADFYSTQGVFLQSRVLESGDTVLLVGGGHGFEVLEEAEMIEVKQGPFLGDSDKAPFTPGSKAFDGLL